MQELAIDSQDEAQKETNIQWFLDNRGDMAANFPNRWAAVDNQQFITVNPDIVEAIRTIRGRELVTNSLIFVFCNENTVPTVVTLADVRTA